IRADRDDMLKWLQKFAEDFDEGIIYKKNLKISKKVDAQTFVKVTTGFTNIKLNKWKREDEVEILPDSDDEEDEEGPALNKQHT
ncbi:hypothetical protein HDV00_012582, partial [Rhizophlyctis rosea]